MSNINFTTKAANTMSKMCFKFKKHSPEIFIFSGIVGTIAGAIMACKATTKLSDVLEDSKKNIEHIHSKADIKQVHEATTHSEVSEYVPDDEKKRELAVVYAKTGLNILKLYGPSIFIEILSIASILSSHKILRKRYVAISAAYAAANNSLKEYRNRVVERFGSNVDKEIMYNYRTEDIETIDIDENGEKINKKSPVNISVDGIICSPHARYFDENCKNYDPNYETNLFLLNAIRNFANDKLVARGYLFLNEVYDELGIDRTPSGQLVGWMHDSESPNSDNYVDFIIHHIYEKDESGKLKQKLLIDFNIDGVVYDLI